MEVLHWTYKSTQKWPGGKQHQTERKNLPKMALVWSEIAFDSKAIRLAMGYENKLYLWTCIHLSIISTTMVRSSLLGRARAAIQTLRRYSPDNSRSHAYIFLLSAWLHRCLLWHICLGLNSVQNWRENNAKSCTDWYCHISACTLIKHWYWRH